MGEVLLLLTTLTHLFHDALLALGRVQFTGRTQSLLRHARESKIVYESCGTSITDVTFFSDSQDTRFPKVFEASGRVKRLLSEGLNIKRKVMKTLDFEW